MQVPVGNTQKAGHQQKRTKDRTPKPQHLTPKFAAQPSQRKGKQQHCPAVVARLVNEAITAHEQNDLTNALCLYQELLAAHESEMKHPEVCWYNAALCLTSLGQYSEAQALYEQKLWWYAPAVRNLFGLLMLGGNQTALSFAQKHLKTLECNPLCLFNIGLLYYRTEQFSKAIEVLSKLVGGREENIAAKSLIVMGRLHQRQGQVSEAISKYRSAQQLIYSKQLETHINTLERMPQQSNRVKPKRNILRYLSSNNFFLKETTPKQQEKTKELVASMASTRHSSEAMISSANGSHHVSRSGLLSQFKEPVSCIRASSFLSCNVSLHQTPIESCVVSVQNSVQAIPAVYIQKIEEFDLFEPSPLPHQLSSAQPLSAPDQDSAPNDETRLLRSVGMATSQALQPLSEPKLTSITSRVAIESQFFLQPTVKSIYQKDLTSSQVIPPKVTSTNDLDRNCQANATLIKKSSVTKAMTVCIHDDIPNPLHKSSHSLYYQAFLLNNLGDYNSALVRLKKALKQDVEDRQAVLTLLVRIYRRLDMPEKEIVYLKQLADFGEREVYARIELLYCRMGKPDKAIQVFKKNLGKHPKNAFLFERIGWLCLRKSSLAESIDYLEKAASLEICSNSIRNMLVHAYSLSQTTKGQCKTLLLQATNQPATVNSHLKLVLSYFLEAEFGSDKRIDLLQKLYSEKHSNSLYSLFIGRAYEQAGRLTEAFQSFRQSALSNPRNSKALFELANMYSASNELNIAQMLLEYIVVQFRIVQQTEHENSEVYLTLGNLNFAKKNFTRALKLYRQALSDQPWNFTLLNHIAECHFHSGNHEKALEYFKKSLRLNARQPDVLLRMAQSSRQMQQLERALKYYSLASGLQGELSRAQLLEQIDCLIQSAIYPQALELLQKLTCDDEDVLTARATCEYLTGSYQKSILLFSQLKLLRESTDTCFNLGVCYHRLQDHKNASAYYLSALESEPQHPQTLFNYGVLLRQLGKSTEGLEYIRRAVNVRSVDEWLVFYVEQLIEDEEFEEAGYHIKHLTNASSPEVRQKAYFLQAKLSVLARENSDFMVKTFSKMFPASRLNAQLQHLLEEEDQRSLVSLQLLSQHSSVSIECAP